MEEIMQETESVNLEWQEQAKKKKRRQRAWIVVLCVLLGLLLAAIGAVAWIWHTNEFTLELNMHGDEKIILE